MSFKPQFVLRSNSIARLAVVLCAAFSGDFAVGEPKNPDAATQQVLRKAQGVVRQLTEEKAALQTQISTLEAEKSAWLNEQKTLLDAKTGLEERVKKLETTLKALEPLPAELQRCKTSIQNLVKTKSTLETRLTESRAREEQALQNQRETIAQARLIQDDNTLLLGAVKEREQWITTCGQNNQKLVKAARAAVTQYRDKSFWDEVGDMEPFTGIGKVKTENAAQKYRYQIEHLKATPFEPETKTPETIASDKVSTTESGGEGDKP